jgi:hypothetical protein
VAQVIVSVNLPPAQAVTGIGDLIRPFATSLRGGIATETQRRVQRFDPGEVHQYLYRLGRQIEAVVGGS